LVDGVVGDAGVFGHGGSCGWLYLIMAMRRGESQPCGIAVCEIYHKLYLF
jgi:hypothetical protein